MSERERSAPDAANGSVTIAIVTFRRPRQLGELLGAIEPQLAEDVQLLIVDNDPAGSASEALSAAPRRVRARCRLVGEHEPGIISARNRALCEVETPWIAFIDDDDMPADGWISALRRRQAATGADVVAGPQVHAIPAPPAWIDGAHCFRDVDGTADPAAAARTCNVLIRVAPEIHFDDRLGFRGGSDTHLFRRLARAGWSFAWAPDAIVHTSVPPDRLTVRWVVRRSFRVGTTAGWCSRDLDGAGSAIRQHGPSALRWLWWGLRSSGRALVHRDRAAAVRALSSFVRALGLVVGAFGGGYEEYRRD